MRPQNLFREFFWIVPFAFVGLVAFTTIRPPQVIPPPVKSRIISDVNGAKVAVPLPFRTVRGSDFLEVTHAPEAVFKIGSGRDRIGFSRSLMSRFFPEVVKNDALWNCPSDLESLLAVSDGVTFFFGTTPPLWHSLGITVLETAQNDDHTAVVTRLANAALGHDAQGEAFIAEHKQAIADFQQELRPNTLTDLPRTLGMTASTEDWGLVMAADTSSPDDEMVGIKNAAVGYETTGRYQDAERILAMNPDIIFVGRESVEEFWNDPRWRGLKAVLNKRVYGGGTGFAPGGPTWHLDSTPLALRYEAEIVHPDRLKPKIRELTRNHFFNAYGYRLSDDEIDQMLGVEEQKNVPGYERFFRNYHVSDGSMEESLGLVR